MWVSIGRMIRQEFYRRHFDQNRDYEQDEMTETKVPERCRIVLIAPMPQPEEERLVEAALSGGDVASLIIPRYDANDADFQARVERFTQLAQARDAAVMVAGEPRFAARAKADGIHFEGRKAELVEIMDKYHPKMLVGCGGVSNRDEALELGETQPDYLFFGRFGYDLRPQPHPRNLALAAWWAEMIRIPCIVQGGSQTASVVDVARTGAEFVALCNAVFAPGLDPAREVAEANALLDREAPSFRDAD